MEERLEDHSNRGCAGTETAGGGRRRDDRTINKSRPRAPCVVGGEQADYHTDECVCVCV